MKPILLLLFSFALIFGGLHAPNPYPCTHMGTVDTTWSGVVYEIPQVLRITGNRLVFVVVVHATDDAESKGTLIGNGGDIPPNASPEMIAAGYYRPTPFSIFSATMTDDASQVSYRAVEPDTAGPSYLESQLLTTVHPGETRIMTIQFPSPPPPAPVDGIIPKQTVSLLLPNARGPITKVVVHPRPRPRRVRPARLMALADGRVFLAPFASR